MRGNKNKIDKKIKNHNPDLIKIPLKHYSVCLKEKMELR